MLWAASRNPVKKVKTNFIRPRAVIGVPSGITKAEQRSVIDSAEQAGIVEAHLIREMHRLGGIGDWDAPYPLYDVSGNLQAASENPTSVDD